MLFLVCSMIALQCVFGSPAVRSVDTNAELIILQADEPNAEILMRSPKWDSYFDKEDDNGYFDDWFGWIKPNSRKQPSVQQRIQTLELRQKILFDLLRCESLDEDDCSHLLARAEVLFKIPPKKKGTKRPKKKQPQHDDDTAEDDPEETSSAPDATTKPPQASTTTTTTTQRNEGSTNTTPEPTTSTTEQTQENGGSTNATPEPTTSTTEPTSPNTQSSSTASTESTTTAENADR
ncbi:hypothetical protein CBL_14191 [Carabus blaptoides fortunei]